MQSDIKRKLAAIMFADIVSYSRLMGTNEEEALKLLKEFEDISSPIVPSYKGCLNSRPSFFPLFVNLLTLYSIFLTQHRFYPE